MGTRPWAGMMMERRGMKEVVEGTDVVGVTEVQRHCTNMLKSTPAITVSLLRLQLVCYKSLAISYKPLHDLPLPQPRVA